MSRCTTASNAVYSNTFTSNILMQLLINHIFSSTTGLRFSVLVDLGEIRLAVGDTRLYCVRTGLPVSRAHYNAQKKVKQHTFITSNADVDKFCAYNIINESYISFTCPAFPPFSYPYTQH